MSPGTRKRLFAAPLLAAALLGGGCSAADDAGNDEAAATGAKTKTFKLNAGAEAKALAKCNDASDRACYLRALDLTNAYWLGVVSEAVYSIAIDDQQPEKAFGAMTTGGLDAAKLNWRERVIFDDSLSRSNAMYFETADGVAVLAFRGTANDQGPANLVTDVQVGQVCGTASGGEEFCVHSGFNESFRHLWSPTAVRYVPSTHCAAGIDTTRVGRETTHCTNVAPRDKVVVRAEMLDYLEKRFAAGNPNRPPHTLFITGHSLGGALATLALNELLLRPNLLPASTNVAVYTYGTPRVGDAAFAKKVFEVSRQRGIPYYRFVHRRDAVAGIKVMGYAHVGRNPTGEDDGLDTFIHLVGANERGPGADPRAAIMSLGHLDPENPGSLADGISDHGMPKYLPLLAASRKP